MLDIKIRKLTIKDRKTFSALLLKLVSNFDRNELTKLIVSDAIQEKQKGSDEETETRFLNYAIGIMHNVIEHFNSDVTEWFADLLGLTVEKYETLPFDTEIHIVNQIAEAEETAGFFGQRSAIYKAISVYLEGVKERMKK